MTAPNPKFPVECCPGLSYDEGEQAAAHQPCNAGLANEQCR
jgi:hypothetical protein